ncbi:MAG TPA: hypothetical protein VMI10_05910 [Terriglobales bacterium]|nr:hypothetical protein [Terriglobales bacterium]
MTHPNSLLNYKGFRLPVAVLLDNIRSMYNVGAFFRAADGVNLEKLWLCGITASAEESDHENGSRSRGNGRVGARLGRNQSSEEITPTKIRTRRY